MTITITPQAADFVLSNNGAPMLTHGKLPLALPTKALAEAIASEWQGQAKYSANAMKLTALAYTAIDRIEPQKANVVEALLVFLDTDTLSYREADENKLLATQQEQWDPVLAWAGKKFGATWQTTSGVMPIDQSPALHKAVGAYLNALDSMTLSALSVLASVYSSLVLAIAVVDRHIDAMRGFTLSRLEEDCQAEQWGVDEEAAARAKRLEDEARAASQFLNLLDESSIRH